MLNSLLQKLSKLIVIILVVFLVLSFAISGIGGSLRDTVSDVAATVGDSIISNRELQRAIVFEKRRQEREEGGSLPEGILRGNVLAQLINNKLLSVETDNLGIKIGEKSVINQIKSDRRFYTKDSIFNKEAFKYFLRQIGESEVSFIEGLKNDEAISTLIKALSMTPIASTKIAESFNRYEGEIRMALLLTIPKDLAELKEISEPSEADLISFFEKEGQNFVTEEYRSISWISANVESVRSEINITEELLEEEYKNRIGEFQEAEKRELMQIFLTDEELINEVYKTLEEHFEIFKMKKFSKGGYKKAIEKAFLNLAKEKASQKEEGTRFGTISRDEFGGGGLFPKDLIGAVFNAASLTFTKPLKSLLGWHIFLVIDVIPEKTEPLSEVRDTLKEALIREQAGEILYQLTGQLEDELASGASLEEVEERLNLKKHSIDKISRDGIIKEASSKITIPNYGDFLAIAFSIQAGVNSELAASDDGLRYFVLRVDGVTPSRLLALDEIRGDVITAWKKTKKAEAHKALAEREALLLKKPRPSSERAVYFKNAAERLSVELIDTKPLYRDGSNTEKIPTPLLVELFSINSGESTGAYLGTDGSYKIALLKEIKSANPDDYKYGVRAIKKRLAEEFSQDLLGQYITYLMTIHPIEITNKIGVSP